MSFLRFTVQGTPVPQARARIAPDARTGKMRGSTPARSKAWKKLVAMHAMVAARQARWRLDGRFSIRMTVRRAWAQGDWDNHAKGVCDALKGIAWKDDAQVLAAEVLLVDGSEPGVDVEVRRMEAL